MEGTVDGETRQAWAKEMQLWTGRQAHAPKDHAYGTLKEPSDMTCMTYVTGWEGVRTHYLIINFSNNEGYDIETQSINSALATVDI
jgi:hypothetical protein